MNSPGGQAQRSDSCFDERVLTVFVWRREVQAPVKHLIEHRGSLWEGFSTFKSLGRDFAS